MAHKILICRCEDVTASDIRRAVATGFTDVEEVKRYTGFGTGPCQGKECLRLALRAIADATGVPPEELHPFTTRPPLSPTPLVVLASGASDHERDGHET